MKSKAVIIEANDLWRTHISFIIQNEKSRVVASSDVEDSITVPLDDKDLEYIKQFCEEALASRRNK